MNIEWTTLKPDFACVIATRSAWKSKAGKTSFTYDIFLLEWVRGDGDNEYYLACMDKDGEEWGALEELTVDGYHVLEILPTLDEVHKEMSRHQ